MAYFVFRLVIRQQNCIEHTLTLHTNGDLWTESGRLGQIRVPTLQRIRSIAQKAEERKLLPFFVHGMKGGPLRSVFFYDRQTDYVEKYDPNSEVDLTKTERIAQKLPWAILRILEKEEPFYFNTACGFFMINRAKPIPKQIEAIRAELATPLKSERKKALFIFLLTALYWFDASVWVPDGGGKPLSLHDCCFFNLEKDLPDKSGYLSMPFRELLRLLREQKHGPALLGYQPTWQYWSLDAFADCFFDCNVHNMSSK